MVFSKAIFVFYTMTLMLMGISNLADFTAAQTEAPPIDDSSCDRRCEETYVPSKPCYCNEACRQYENCCFDYYQICRPDFIWSDDWQEYDGHIYKYFANSSMTANQAVQSCKASGGLLLSINSPEENEFVKLKVLKKRTLSAFMGGSDVKSEGTWIWTDGSQMALPMDNNKWQAWFDGQPDNSGGDQNCAIMTNYQYWDVVKFMIENYVWRDYSCGSNIGKQIQGYVCEGTTACDPNPCNNNGSCEYAGVQQEYRCVCKDNYLGDHCQYHVVEGEPWTRCGDTQLKGPNGIVTSPLYPQHYPNNVDCQWNIEVEQQGTVHLQFLDFQLEGGKDCTLDELTVYDGASANDTVLVQKSCGQQLQGVEIRSSSNNVHVDFKSDLSVRKMGFRLAYKTERCGEGVGQSGCGTRQTFTSQCSDINLLHGPQGGEDTCQWLIHVPNGNIVNLTFTEFNILDSGINCSSGHIRVYDGPNEDYPLLGQYCGRRFPWNTFSSDSQVFIKLTGKDVYMVHSKVKITYEAINKSDLKVFTNAHLLTNDDGSFLSSDWSINLQLSQLKYKKWLIKGNPGEKLQLEYDVMLPSNVTSLKIFDGPDDYSTTLVDTEESMTQNMTDVIYTSMFQAFIVLTYSHIEPKLKISYKFQEWLPDLSGCYRPMYYYSPEVKGYENNPVTPRQPVVIMASGQHNYAPGLYCKWKITSLTTAKTLSMDILDFNVFPVSDDCRYDGIMVYELNKDGSTIKYGPFCGSRPAMTSISTSSQNLTVVFYSATRGTIRQGGMLRAVVTVKDKSSPFYQINEMKEEFKSITSAHGVLLSPGFPSLVPPGLYFWIVDSGDTSKYFNIYLYYVRGPGLIDDCSQTFTIFELAQDVKELRHSETFVIKLCSSTDLFIPTKMIKIPPRTKFAVELNTADSSLPQQWQFKMAYTVDTLIAPKEINTAGRYVCEGQDYYFFRGQCYRYIPWVYRHYYSQYNFQQTWQTSQQYCESENGTLVNIYDEKIAQFIKYMLTSAWYWSTEPYQLNNRMIFIGLSNKHGSYEWMDGVQLSYAEWYTPLEKWERSLFHHDTVGTDFINPSNIQPSADVGLLCVAMVPTSPFGSLNYVKIPCEYPMFRSGLICVRPAAEVSNHSEPIQQQPSHTNVKSPQQVITDNYGQKYQVCPEGYVMINTKCLQIFTNFTMVNDYYDLIKSSGDMVVPDTEMSRSNAIDACYNINGSVASITNEEFRLLIKYLEVWRHDELDGNIWLSGTSEMCSFIKTQRKEEFSDSMVYSIEESLCDDVRNGRSVFCQTHSKDFKEICGQDEFQCDNGMCISVDGHCDNINDCMDDSDEKQCDCGEDQFRCDNTKCIPMSLYCDYIDHCGDNSDEKNCISRTCSAAEFRCSNGQCIPDKDVCNFKVDCVDHSDETTCESQCKGVQCFSGSCINPMLKVDLIPDCPGFALEDEKDTSDTLLTFFDVFKNNVEDNGTYVAGCDRDGGYTQCRDGYQHCYRRSELCIYDTVVVDELTGTEVEKSCRDGTHLRTNCDVVEKYDMFQCTTIYQGYYIPLRKLCDGKRDCPAGEDELDCDQYICPGLYRCKDSNYCISHTEVCDGTVQCLKHRDDEKYCQMEDALCNQGCSCYGHIVNCEYRNITSMPDYSNTTTHHNARLLNLKGNFFKLKQMSLRMYYFLGKLILSENGIENLPIGIFKDLANLFELNLSFNHLKTFEKGVFEGLRSIEVLDLSNNLLSELSSDSLYGLTTVKHLILSNNKLNIVPDNTFNQLSSLSILNTDARKFCCIAKQVDVCTPAADEFSSCEDLMASYPLQICIWILGMMSLVGNGFVIVWRIMKDKNKVASFFILNLGISDLLMGMYMIIIASVDVHFRGRYIIYSDDWKNSTLCQFAGVLATLSSEVSVFMLTAITTERFLAIVFPLKFGQMRMSNARIIAFTGWIVCFFFSVFPTTKLPFFGDAFFGRTGVCLPFHLSDQKLPGWEYSVFVFLIVNFISFVLIFVQYVAIFVTVMMANKKMGNKSTGNTDEYQLAKKLVIIVATDFMCWVPIILIGFIALSGVPIPPQVSAWIAVFILPLNSSINPILYTISALEYRKKPKSKRYTSTCNSSVANTSMTTAS